MMGEKRGFKCFLYVGILLCFVLMFFFIVPQSDILLFARDTQPSLRGAAEGAFFYGNGRFLGNIVGMFLSHHFVFAFLPLALCLTGLVFLLNRLVFSGSSKTVLPIAFAVAFPSIKMLGECYYMYAAFVNYVMPIFFVLLSVLLLKTMGEGQKMPPAARIALCLLLFVSSAAAALFSENTTVVLLTLSVLWVVSDARRSRSFTLHGVCNLLGAGLGALVMLLIPRLSGSAHKLDGYRGFAFDGIPKLAHNVLASFVRFSEVVNGLTLTITLLSMAFLLVLRDKKSRPVYSFAKAVFAVYPLLSLLLAAVDSVYLRSMYIPIAEAVNVIPVLLYAAAIVIAVRSIGDRPYRLRCVGYLILLASSVGPMLLVTQYGIRTYYTTFVILTVWALELLLRERAAARAFFKKQKLDAGIITAALACVLVVFSGFLFAQSVVNFNFFAVRTAYIAEQIEAGAEETTVPILPCTVLTIEDDWGYSVADILPDESAIRLNQTVDLYSCDNPEDYEAVFAGSPVRLVRYAFEHLACKNPRNIHPQF